MVKTIIYRHQMDRSPSLEDRALRVGMNEFFLELQNLGWIDKEHCALKNFIIDYEGHSEQNNNYIQWSATLMELF